MSIKSTVETISFIVAKTMDGKNIPSDDIDSIYNLVHKKIENYLDEFGALQSKKYFFKRRGVPEEDLTRDYISDRLFEMVVKDLRDKDIINEEGEF